MPLASAPPAGTPVPFAITLWAAAHGRRVDSLVWRNELGGLTARLVGPEGSVLYAKWSPHDLEPEAERLSWLAGRFPVPVIVDYEELDDGWLVVTAAIPGESAVSKRWSAEPGRAAAAIGEGLARLHSLDPSECPFGPPAWVDEGEVDILVVAHGDACAPNTILADDGSFAGIVDVGELGVTDRWADLSIASWSLEWNYGPGHEASFWAAYGEAPDPDRIRRFRSLWGEP